MLSPGEIMTASASAAVETLRGQCAAAAGIAPSMIERMGALQAIVFDFDGVLIDSETPEYESHRRIFERCGVPLTTGEGHDDRWFRALCARSPNALSHDDYHAEKRRIFDAMLPREPMRGIAALLEAIREAGIPAAIASSSPASWVTRGAAHLGITGYFQAVVSGDEVARRKPAPDLYLEAARRLAVDPARTIAIEDSGPGIAAARAAGMTTVAIPHWLTSNHDLSAADLRVTHAGELTLTHLESILPRL
jgi:HAD superfamily hydrolase (TIGR01509 family)